MYYYCSWGQCVVLFAVQFGSIDSCEPRGLGATREGVGDERMDYAAACKSE